MSERCDRPVSASRDARGNDLGLLSLNTFAFAAVAVLLFYTWFWALLVGGLLGCTLAVSVLRSHRLRLYCAALQLYLTHSQLDAAANHNRERGCAACGGRDCARRDPRVCAEPWTGLRVHKQLDQAIEDFYNTILENFVLVWYARISRQPHFTDELKRQLRHASAALLTRALKINYPKFIIDKLVPCALHHHSIWMAAQNNEQRAKDIQLSTQNSRIDSSQNLTSKKSYTGQQQNGSNHTNISDSKPRRYDELSSVEVAALNGPLRCSLHPAVTSRAEELKYLRCVTTAIMPLLLRKEEVGNRVVQVLIREIFAGWVLLSITDALADPYILNTLIVLATGDETMSALPKTPNYQVEFLESFARPSDSQLKRARLLRLDVDTLLTSPDYLYALMQHMKNAGYAHLLQFCKDTKPFQMKILNPDLTPNEEVSLFNEAWDLYVQYFDPDSPSAISFAPAVVEEMRAVLSEGPANVKKLQTSKALYQSAKYADSLLEDVFIPRFLHSEEFYRLLLGPRMPTEYHKQMTKKPQDKLYSTAIKLGNRLKSAIRTSTIDGQILDCCTNADASDGDAADNMDVLRYLDGLAERAGEEHDLSSWEVTFTAVDIRQLEAKRGVAPAPCRVFTVSVERPSTAERWSVERSERDVHLLRAKLVEFHGESLLQDLSLPSRRDNSPLETLRYKYEDFVQRLLQLRLLTTSELLHIFLSAQGDFELAVQRASLGAGGSDLSNIYQTVTHRLRKEKGQHLETLMNALLLCADLERYQAMKHGASLAVEEAEEVEETASRAPEGEARGRSILRDTFGNNFDVEREAAVTARAARGGASISGFTQCLVYILTRVVRARALVCGVVGCAGAMLRDVMDRSFVRVLASALTVSQQRLGHLIHLAREMLFVHKTGRQRSNSEQYERARQQLRTRTPHVLSLLLGAELRPALDGLLSMLQHSRLNKQLVYNLLDLCLAELFPEIVEKEEDLKTR